MLHTLWRHSLFHFSVIAVVGLLFYQGIWSQPGSASKDLFPESGSYARGNLPTHTYGSGEVKCEGGVLSNQIMVVDRKPPEYYLVRENCELLENPVLLSESEILLHDSKAKGLEYRRQAYQRTE